MSQAIDRRSFITKVAGAAVFVLTPFAGVLRPAAALAAPRHTGFRFIHDEAVVIVLSFAKKDDRYDVSVRHMGDEVEFFANVDPMRLHRLRTTHFEVEYFDPVAA